MTAAVAMDIAVRGQIGENGTTDVRDQTRRIRKHAKCDGTEGAQVGQ